MKRSQELFELYNNTPGINDIWGWMARHEKAVKLEVFDKMCKSCVWRNEKMCGHQDVECVEDNCPALQEPLSKE